MKTYNIAILGATGAVGREMLNALAEFDVPVGELKLLASKRSVGKTMRFKDRDIVIEEATENSFEGMNYVLGAVQNPMAVQFAPAIVKAGAIFIDNSSAFRLNDDVPLIVPEINGADAANHHGIISNPNCSTIISILAIAGIAKLSPIETMIASTYQAVSGAGQGGQIELEKQLMQVYSNSVDADSLDLVASSSEKSSFISGLESDVFSAQIAFNVIPMIGSEKDNGYTSEEMKMQNEGRKILHMPDMKVTCTCVRVPVMRSHSISITLRTKDKITVEQAREAIKNYPGCVLVDGNDSSALCQGRSYPTPLDTSNQNLVYVGRIREDLTDDHGLTLWCCGDQVRKGAATNAVQILCSCIEQNI